MKEARKHQIWSRTCSASSFEFRTDEHLKFAAPFLKRSIISSLPSVQRNPALSPSTPNHDGPNSCQQPSTTSNNSNNKNNSKKSNSCNSNDRLFQSEVMALRELSGQAASPKARTTSAAPGQMQATALASGLITSQYRYKPKNTRILIVGAPRREAPTPGNPQPRA